ncbi:hypothetical protein GCM10027422_43460 [Hymenobacter arcticus]
MQTPSQVQALLAANRLEARPRSPEFNRALRAEVRDPTWLLARQWQMREFRAEDRGTPAAAAVRLRQQPLSCLATPSLPAGRPYHPQHQPLEAAVEAQPRAVGLGLRLQMGQYWRRLLRTALAAQPAPGTAQEQAAALAVWAAVYPLAQATDEVTAAQQATAPEALALVQLAGSQALDGYALYQDLLAPYRTELAAELADSELLAEKLKTRHPAQTLLAADFPNSPFATHARPLDLEASLATAGGRAGLVALADGLDVLARQFIAAFHRLYFLGDDNATWSTEGMAYGFRLGAGADGLTAAHYPGGAALPWYAVDRAAAAPSATVAAAVTLETRTLLPTEVLFPGAPAARWWEFEDRRVDFGQVTGHAADWGRMLLQEFMFLYQNDWHTVPYAVAPGTVCQVESLEVTDVFGQTYRLQPAGAGQQPEDPASPAPVRIDNDANRWRLFAQTDPATTPGTPALAPVLYVPAAVLSPQAGRPSEQVSFRREEATNLVWAVETIVPDGFAGGLDGSAAAAQAAEMLRAPATPPPATATDADAPAYRYQLAGTVPENWLPFVPVQAANGSPALEQGLLPRQVPGRTFLPTDAAYYVQPRTPLLQLHGPTAPYRLHEHEVPAAGVRVEGRSYRARWLDGRVLHWFGRQRGPAQPGGSSGLAFDLLLPGGQ